MLEQHFCRWLVLFGYLGQLPWPTEPKSSEMGQLRRDRSDFCQAISSSSIIDGHLKLIVKTNTQY
jgi:hypothetical protein